MAIPSGSGTEVLKRVSGTIRATTTSVLTVGSNKICTVLSIILWNDLTSGMKIYLNNGSADLQITTSGTDGATEITANQTFVWNDKFVLTAGDILKIQELSDNGPSTYWVSYIEQDWS